MSQFLHEYLQVFIQKDFKGMMKWYEFPFVIVTQNRNEYFENARELEVFLKRFTTQFPVDTFKHMTILKNKVWNQHGNIFQCNVCFGVLDDNKDIILVLDCCYVVKEEFNQHKIYSIIALNMFYDEKNSVYIVKDHNRDF